MNNDLISREALKKAFEDYEAYSDIFPKAVYDIIDNAPTVSEITKEKLSIAYDQGYKDGRDNWLQEEPKGDLISREALQDKFDNYCPHIDCKKCRWYSLENSFHKCALIDNAPTVEPVKQCKYCKHCGNEDYCSNCHSDHSLFEYYERTQGEWAFDEKGSFYCDQCGKYPHDQYATTDFCPNCGAKMKGGAK